MQGNNDFSGIRQKRDEFLVNIRKTEIHKLIHKNRTRINQNQFPSKTNKNTPKLNYDSLTELRNTLNQYFTQDKQQQNIKQLSEIVEKIRTVISQDDKYCPSEKFIELGLVPHFISFISPEYDNHRIIQSDALWT